MTRPLRVDAQGFVPTDDAGRVRGVPDVFAAGDMTAFPVKQGGIAAQQADAVAQLLAVRAGAPIVGLDVTRVLTARLHGPRTPVVLSTVLDGDGRALDGGRAGHAATPWWPHSKVRSRHLAAHLAARGVGG